MASKLLNVRMDEEMLKDLKEVCGELGINVTDAIKSFSKELIEKKKLPTEEKEKNETKELTWERLCEELEEHSETKNNIKEYEEMMEQISDVILSCNKDLRKFIRDKAFTYKNSYSELVEKFKEEYGNEVKNKILNIIVNFYEFEYKDTLDSWGEIWEEQEKFQQEKYINAMENIKKKNPELYKELLNDYTYNINVTEMYFLNCNGYFETKKILEELLTPKEIKEYIKYKNEIDSYKTEQDKNNFRDSIPDERWEVLNSIFNKIKEYHEKTEKMKDTNIDDWEIELAEDVKIIK